MKKEYGRVVWSAEDAMDLFKLSEEQAHEFLAKNERNLQDRMVEYGWTVLETCGEMDGLERNDI